MRNVMLDLETFGTAPGCVVRSIGAVEFELHGATGKTFYENIMATSCTDVGLTIDKRTAEWWSQQSKEAQEALLVDPQRLEETAKRFVKWFHDIGAEVVWSHGAAFDAVIWEAACRAVKGSVPWKFWNVRDTRTVFDLFEFDIRDIPRDGTYHNALDDARYQVRCMAAALASGRAPELAPSVFE